MPQSGPRHACIHAVQSEVCCVAGVVPVELYGKRVGVLHPPQRPGLPCQLAAGGRPAAPAMGTATAEEVHVKATVVLPVFSLLYIACIPADRAAWKRCCHGNLDHCSVRKSPGPRQVFLVRPSPRLQVGSALIEYVCCFCVKTILNIRSLQSQQASWASGKPVTRHGQHFFRRCLECRVSSDMLHLHACNLCCLICRHPCDEKVFSC